MDRDRRFLPISRAFAERILRKMFREFATYNDYKKYRHISVLLFSVFYIFYFISVI